MIYNSVLHTVSDLCVSYHLKFLCYAFLMIIINYLIHAMHCLQRLIEFLVVTVPCVRTHGVQKRVKQDYI